MKSIISTIKKFIPSWTLKYICGADTFIRHRCLAGLIENLKYKIILDVGGEGRLLYFLCNTKIINANIKQTDVCCKGNMLPFKDDSFDISVSLDTLEHMPKNIRPAFCEELARVSRKGFVLCAPLGTPENIENEKKLLASGQLWGSSLSALKEHIEFGIPLPEEVNALAELIGGRIFYQRKSTRPMVVVQRYAYPRQAIQMLINQDTNRFYLTNILDK